MYRCEASSIAGFVQQLAVSYLCNGYWFYVPGRVPQGKDPRSVDRKLIARYGIDVSKWARARRRRRGESGVQYLRHDRFFVLLATHGRHLLFDAESAVIKDARHQPVRYAGYSVSFRRGHPHVRIERRQYNVIKAHLLSLAVHRRLDTLSAILGSLPFEPYAPVRRQLLNILRSINRARRAAGLDQLPFSCLRLRRRIVQPFALPGRVKGDDQERIGDVRQPQPSTTTGADIEDNPGAGFLSLPDVARS